MRLSAHDATATAQFADTRNSDIIKIILAIFLPPVGVFLERGCGADLLINILLTVLGYIPYVLHYNTTRSRNLTGH